MFHRSYVLAALTAGGVFVAGCKKETPAAPAEEQAPQPITLKVLVTADENGYLLPHTVDGETRGGAAKLLGQWIGKEGHCIPGGANCSPERTIALSTGDHFGGPALSSRFGGEPVAEAMGHMNYAATGLGNHDLNFGHDQLARNIAKSSVPVIAANLVAEGPGSERLRFPDHVLVERDGVKVGVIGLHFVKAPERSMPGRYEGARVAPYQETLARAVPAVRAEGADAVVVIMDDCPSAIEEAVTANPDWNLALVAGGDCDEPFEKTVGGTLMASPGKRFEKYLAATLTLDPAKPAGERLTGVEGEVVEVSAEATPEPGLAQKIAAWEKKTQDELSKQIGFSSTALELGSPELTRWLTTALRESTETDAVLLNKGGLREGLPAGKITVGDVYSAIPFENSVMVVELTGAQLAEALANEEALSDLTVRGQRVLDAKGKPLDPNRKYKVATIEFLYFGGDDFKLESADANPTHTGMLWQAPVLDWMRTANTSEQAPLQTRLQ